jgi:hypothetical protein
MPVLVTDRRGLTIWQRYARLTFRDDGPAPDAYQALIAASQQFVLSLDRPVEGGLTEVAWVCPGCGFTTVGFLTELPDQSDWSLRWQNTGSEDKPTLVPDLECYQPSGWRNCGARWHLRDGFLYSPAELD